ncbi:MAG: cytidylate kinase-like family protein [Thermodesulfobacteriota bacterium]
MKEDNPRVITISRQMGSGGSYVGYSVAKELGFQYVDREILRQAADRLHTDPEALEHLEERSPGLLEKITQGFSYGMPEIAVSPLRKQPVDYKELFALEGKIMNEIADRYQAVIVGRGGFYVLRNRPEVFKIFIHAPLDFRLNRYLSLQKSHDSKEVRARLKESDQVRARFIKEMAGLDWMDSRNYHLCFDSSVIDFSTITAVIVDWVKKKGAEV